VNALRLAATVLVLAVLWAWDGEADTVED